MTFEDRKKAIQKARKLRDKSQEEIDAHPFVIQKRKLITKHDASINLLLTECTHEEVEKKSEYYGGSYLDTAHTDYWSVCTLCGKKSDRKTKDHGWYG